MLSSKNSDRRSLALGVSRRALLTTGAGLAGSALLPVVLKQSAFAVGLSDKAPIGTWPAGSDGKSVTIGATVPRTGAYAVQGEDELKGMQLAVEHINSGNELIKKISPKTKNGVLGKEVKLVVADSGAKPNEAVQEQQRFITEDKIVLMTGSTSSAVAVALNKFAEREKVLYAWQFPAPTTPPARIVLATASASASTARRQLTRSALSF